MRYYVIAGEASGDLHASNLIRELKLNDAHASFHCWGGDLMQAQGAELVKHYRDLAFMGFTEVLMNLNTITANLKFCRKDIQEYKPDAIILVDYPGFNLRIAAFAHELSIPVIYYISPQVWAWKKSRIKTIRRVVDKMMVILPFEKAFYAENGIEVEFPGHPLLDAILLADKNQSQPATNGRPLVALLPGSRKQEISRVLPLMLSVVPDFPEVDFVIAGVSGPGDDFYRKFTGESKIEVVYNQTYELLKRASAALVTSGTATLETALIGTPEVVCYKGGRISYLIARLIIKVPYISLVNLIMNKPVVKELIQGALSRSNLKAELFKLLNDTDVRKQMMDNYDQLRLKLGGGGASAKAAQIVTAFLHERGVTGEKH